MSMSNPLGSFIHFGQGREPAQTGWAAGPADRAAGRAHNGGRGGVWGVGGLRRPLPAARAVGPNHSSGVSWLPARAGPRWTNQPSFARPLRSCPWLSGSSSFSPPLVAVPQGLPRSMSAADMRAGTLNIDFSEEYLNGRIQERNKMLSRLLGQMDVLALQELGQWDDPLQEEP